MTDTTRNNAIFRTPFSREYWRLAFSELKNPRMLVFAAMILALRIALKPVRIPIVADLNENIGFIVNAFGSMVYGPVVALLSGALSDALGFVLFPNGVYFPPFMITEMAGSFVFALFLYRADISVPRLLLSRFCICLFVNVLLSYPIWVWYYEVALGKPYPIAWIRVIKNLALFPIETVVLTVVFRHLLPPFRKLGYLYAGPEKLALTKKHIALLAALTLLGAGITAGYAIYQYDNRSLSADYTPAQRLEMNRRMGAIVAEEAPDKDLDALVTIIESARSTVFSGEITYQVAIYRIDAEKFAEKAAAAQADPAADPYTRDTLDGYSKSPASKDDALIRVGSGRIVADKKTGDKISTELQWEP